MAQNGYVSVSLTPEAKGCLERLTLALSHELGRRVTLSEALIIMVGRRTTLSDRVKVTFKEQQP